MLTIRSGIAFIMVTAALQALLVVSVVLVQAIVLYVGYGLLERSLGPLRDAIMDR